MSRLILGKVNNIAIVILCGLFFAFLINARTIIGLDVQRQEGRIVGTIELRAGLIPWVIMAVSLFFVTLMFVYALAENFQIFAW